MNTPTNGKRLGDRAWYTIGKQTKPIYPMPPRRPFDPGSIFMRTMASPFVIAVALAAMLAPVSHSLAGGAAPMPGDADFPSPSPSARFTEKVAAIRSGNYDLAMIGDSITQCVGDADGEWLPLKAVWEKHFAPRKAINLGYSGYRTENILWQLQNGELDFQQSPKVITLLIGTNNTDDQHYKSIHTGEQVFAGTKTIVELIRAKHPTTKILILRPFPCGGPGSQTSYQRKYNRSADALAALRRAGELGATLADNTHVFHLDIGHVFLRPDGSINTDLMPDLIHPNAAGAEAWAQAIEPTLARLMGDKPGATSRAADARFIRDLRAGKKITIVTMGTSLTGGTWRWPDVMMDDWLNKEFPGQVTFFNEGVGASASGVGPGNNPALSGLGKLPAVLAHKPDVVFIEFTTNDAYLPYKISVEDSRKNLNTIIDKILEANPKTEIILQTMNTVMDKPGSGPHATDRPKLADYARGYRDVAKARGLRLVDHLPNWDKLMRENPARFDELVPDRIHPQLPGYREILLPELKKSLAPFPATP